MINTTETEQKITDAQKKALGDITNLLNSELADHIKLEAIGKRCSRYGGQKYHLLSIENIDNAVNVA